ncbi:tripartite tricarboxylate transporter substrate binding protein [Comamonas sp. Tr-654]|uniref:Bug family tripartite tricarboxylate transporter substrate binding protein n=1 Tax=Comamonas sp. Tr-654 TaxID=2608341 RepID=UPI001420AC0F|nr:tripartite tricarboxylate transporter substrate binding protein [Comamonas sp. Tr-654]NIF82668.1 tripartite tricarboxylate transporter substrate binding protein [Comamonas sp. Tr-654]
MSVTSKLFTKVALAASATLLMTAGAQAQTAAGEYPSRTITFVVPYAAGGSSDARSRQIANRLSVAFGQSVIVENRPGAGGNIGTEYIARAKPDGYVVGLGNFAPLAVNKSLFRKLNYDPATDLVPIIMIEKGPLVLSVNRASPHKSAPDLIKAAQAKPNSLSYASAGIGGSHHLAGELFQDKAQIQMTHVAYKGGAPATNDLIAGNVDLMFEWIFAAMPYTSGPESKLRPLAITSQQRSPLLKDVPTFEELGIKGMEISNWFGVVAPKGTPAPIVAKLNAAINVALKEPEMIKAITSLGDEVVGGTPEHFDAFIKAETARWSALVKAHKIKPE